MHDATGTWLLVQNLPHKSPDARPRGSHGHTQHMHCPVRVPYKQQKRSNVDRQITPSTRTANQMTDIYTFKIEQVTQKFNQ